MGKRFWLYDITHAGALCAKEPQSPVKPESVGLSTERLKRIDQLIDQYIAERKIGGAVELVARKGKINSIFRKF